MPKLLSNRKPVTPPSKLTDDRFKFLGTAQAQPALGAAPTPNEGYTIKTDESGKATFSNTLGKLEFQDQTISTTVPGDMVFTNTNGSIVISPFVKAQVTSDLEVLKNIIVRGDNPLGTGPVVSNVLYVTVDGDDRNDGRALDASRACRTISGAVRSPYYQEGTVIKVQSGHYYEENPIPLKGYTCVIGDDLRTVFIEPLNRDLDLFHVNSGVYIAQMQMRNLRRGSVERYAPGGAGTYTTGAYCVAFPPSLDNPIDLYYSPYIQNCTNQTGPWLKDGTMYVPNQTVQIPDAVGTSTWTANSSEITVYLVDGIIEVGMAVNDGANEGYRNAQLLLQANKKFLQAEVNAYIDATFSGFDYDKSLSMRDVGTIIDAVSGDARFGGNGRSIIAGLSYWNGTTSVIAGRSAECLAAIQYLAALAQQIIINATILSPYQLTVNQYTNVNYDKGGVISTRLASSFDIITNIIVNGKTAEPTKVDDLFGLIYPTGLSPNRVNVASTVTSVTPLGDNAYSITLSTSTVAASDNATVYFGATSIYPSLDADVPPLWTAADNDGIFADRRVDAHGAGGGALVDGNAPSLRSPIQSFVFDAFTQLCQGGHGIHIINNGYAQLVSVFTLFCDQAVTVENGGIASITNSNANFGDLCLVAKGLGKLGFSGIVWNPANPTNIENGEFYPLGYWPQLQKMEVFIPNSVNRPHIGLVMEVVAPDTYLDYNGDRVNFVNEQGYPGYLIAVSNTSTVSTGSYTISGIETTDIAVGHTLYIRDIYGSDGPVAGTTATYITPGAQVIDVSYQTVTLDQPILTGGGDSTNPNFLNLYFCGNAYYTVLSSIVDETLSSTSSSSSSVIPSEITTTSQAIAYARDLALQIIANQTATLYQSTVPQVIDSTFSSGASAASAVTEKFNTIIDIIQGGAQAEDYTINGQFAKTDQSILDAKKLLEKNRNFIQAQTTAYADTLWPSHYTYNAELCARDTGLIVDAIAQDMLFGGTSQSTFAAIQYWNQGDTVIPNELYQTTAALTYLKTLAEEVVTNTTGTRYQSTFTQVINTNTATSIEQTAIGTDFDVVLNILENGIAGVTDNIVPNSLTSSTNVNTVVAFDKLQENKPFLQHEIIAYVEANKNFTYDQAKCDRDTGLIVDSLAFDLLYPTENDSQSTFSALQYYVGTNYITNIAGEITTTTNAINYLKTVAQEIVTNTTGTRYTAGTQVFDLVNPGTISEANTIKQHFESIVGVLNSGTVGATDLIVPNIAASTATDVVNAYNLLEANRAYLQSEVIAYIDATRTGSFVYNEKKCKRDTGLIIDAIAQDLYFGGTSQSTFAGLQYWNHTAYEGAIGSEVTTTTNAINYASEIAQKVILNDLSGTRYYTGPTTQTTNPVAAGTISEVAFIADEFVIITDIISGGTVGVTDMIVPNGLTISTDQSVLNAYNLLVSNKAYIQAEVVAYVDDTNPGFSYNATTCSRDVGYMIDSVAFDLLYGGNRQAIQSGVYYYNFDAGSSAIPGEGTETIAAYNFMKTLVGQIITATTASTHQSKLAQVVNLPAATGTEVTALQAKVTNLVNIIDNGPTAAPSKTSITVTPSGNANIIKAINLLEANKEFIKAEVTGWINQTYGVYSYDEDMCFRDVGFMVDSVAFDLVHGGNRQSIQSALSYYGFSSNAVATELPQVTAAFKRLKSVISTLVTGGTVQRSTSNATTQITGLPAATTVEATAIATKIDYMNTVIVGGTSEANSLTPISLTASSSVNIQRAFDILLANRSFIRAEIIAYTNDNFANFVYNAATCYRDVAYMVDSISFDLLYGGNRQATQSGVYYFGHNGSSTVIPGEIPQTTAAYNFIKTLVADIVVGNTIVDPQQDRVTQVISASTGTSSEVVLADSLVDNITNIITNGPGVAPSATSITLDRSSNADIIAATALLESNREFITAEVIAYISNTFHTKFIYDETICSRDTGLIVDALVQDLLFGGTSQSTFAGIQYWGQGSTVIPGELTTTTNAINYASALAQKVLLNDTTGYRYQNTVTQITTLTAATSVQALTVKDDFDVITNILTNGIANITDEIVPNSVRASTSTAIVNAFNNLQANKQYIQNEVVAYVDATANFQYNEALCYRDVGLFVDSLAFDVLYPTTYDSQTTFAAAQYWNHTSYTGAIASEITTTTDSLTYLSSIAAKVVVNDTSAPRYTSEVQTTSTAVGTNEEAAIIGNEFGIILGILGTGPASITDAIVPNGRASNSTATVNAYNLLLANKTYLQTETVAYVEANKTVGFNYNTSTCYRDVGYIIDSIAFDLLHGGNRQAIQSGAYYYSYSSTSTVVPNELPQVTAAYNYMKEIISSIVSGQTIIPSNGNAVEQVTYMLPASSTEVTKLNRLISTITNIINVGPSAIVAKTPISLVSSSSQSADNAFNLLLANREFIQTEVTSWINNSFCGFSYDKAKCYRDVAYMIDSVSIDLLYGGNRQAIQSGVYYFGHNGEDTKVPNEIPQVTAAYSFISNIVDKIVTGTTITTPQQTTVSQVSSIGSQYYNPVKCNRDTGIIVDSMVTDLLFPGNGATQSNFAGLQYWNQAGYTGAIARELTTTTNAIKYLSTLAQQVVANTTGTRYQSTVTQVTNLTTASSVQSARVKNEFTVVTNILTTGTAGITDLIVANGTEVVSTDAQHAYALLDANKAFMTAEVVAYIESTKTAGFTYNQTTCARDVGYMVDSIGFDVLYGGNRQAIQSGVYYYSFSTSSSVVVNESTQTIAAYTKLRNILPSIITNVPIEKSPNNTITQVTTLTTATSVEGTSLQDMVDLITNIITTGPSVADTKISVDLTKTANADVLNAVAILEANKAFIVKEIDSFLNYEYFVGTDAEAVIVQRNISTITNIIVNGPEQATEVTSLGVTPTTNLREEYAARLLDANRNFIRAETIAYINNTYDTGYTFNQDRCFRDSGLIVDSLAFDLLHTGNSQSTFAALQYWGQDSYTGQIGGEVTTTTNAVRYLREVAQKVILGETIEVSIGNASTQTVTTPGSEFAASIVVDNISIIVDILSNGTVGITDTIVPNGLALTDTGITNAYAALQANKAFIQAEVVARINVDNPYFDYNELTCFRDVGYIVDSVSFDLLHGGNRQSIQSGVYYYRFNGDETVIRDEISEVISSYDYLRSIVSNVVTGTLLTNTYQGLLYQDARSIVEQITSMPVATGTEVTAVQANVDLITGIIGNGPTAAPAKTPISLTASGDTNVVSAYNILLANREFIQAELLAYTIYNFTYVPTYNKNKCYRDMGSIVDAVIYDIAYGGNYRSVNTGNGYYYRKGQYHIISLEQNVLDPRLFVDGASVNFYQQSYISASGYLFEYVGAGTQYGALPQVGTADPVQSKEVVQLNNGKVFFTSTDQNGDFRIGPSLVISQATGILSGRTFQKSLYAEMTPFVLVIGA